MSSPVLNHRPDADTAFGLAKVPTLAEVLNALDADAGLTPRKRSDLRSAVLTSARVLGLPPASIPARLDLLRRQLAQVLPAAHGISRGRWNSVRSLFGHALRLGGLEVLPGRSLAELDPAICALERKMFEKILGRGLRLSQCRLDGDRSCDFEAKPGQPPMPHRTGTA